MSQAIETSEPPSLGQASADPYSISLEKINVADSELFSSDTMWGYFERLRKEDPVHYCAESEFGPYWSVTRFNDIVEVEKNDKVFSSVPTIVIGDPDPSVRFKPSFIAMDGPKHQAQRKTVQPVAAPRNLKLLEPVIREKVIEILDSLPIGETFDWVDRVSIELTTGMLATIFDFPYEQRRKLTYWSDIVTSGPNTGGVGGISQEDRRAALMECLEAFSGLWKERENKPESGRLDLISLLANGAATKDMDPMEYIGTLILLIVGGNDTKLHLRRCSGSERESEGISEAARQPRSHPQHGE